MRDQRERTFHEKVIGWLRGSIEPERILHEERLGPGAKADFVVLGEETVAIVEAKASRVRTGPYATRQLRRYEDLARLRWPGRRIALLVVWPDPLSADGIAGRSI